MTTRRRFLATSAMTLSAATYNAAAQQPNERIRLAVMGVRGRGRQLINGFSPLENAEIVAVVDPDANVVPDAIRGLRREPAVQTDIRRTLEDRNIDALIVAAPDHWHALATVWACQAGKHVYCEKPASHNIAEGRKMVEAARRHNRVVQLGTQRRSAAHSQSAVELVRSGRLGKIPFARTWIAGNRPAIGRRENTDVPRGVDYNLWLGPAPETPFNPNRFHYNWHWNWDHGTGELGNNGIHALDLARWILNLDAPTRVSSGGGVLFYEDDHITPDTQVAVYEFPTTTMIWEHRIWSRTGVEGESWGVCLYGERGTLTFHRKGWTVTNGIDAFDRDSPTDEPHYRNFLDCVRTGRRPNADIEEGHKSTRLCHLGNIAIRTGRTIRFNAENESIIDDAEANRLLTRTYRRPFEMPATV